MGDQSAHTSVEPDSRTASRITPARSRPGRERIQRILNPRSIAIIGASDNSGWSRMTYASLAQFGFTGDIHLVNRNSKTAHGRATVPSCADIPGGADLAVLLVPNRAVPDALREAGQAGIPAAVLLGAGYAESGPEGRAKQDRLGALADKFGMSVVGPNTQGFANLIDGASGWTAYPPDPLLVGSVAVICQSGNLAMTIADFAVKHAIGISHMISTGNELNLDILDFLDCLVEDDRVRSIAVFAESIREPQYFLRVAARAAALRKPIVMLKVGSSALSAELARTHTGALVGDDKIVDLAMRSACITRVETIEELVYTAGLLAQTGPLPPGGLGFVSISGGINDIVADRAEALGIPLPQFGDATRERIQGGLIDFAAVQNPLDLTGGVVGRKHILVDPLKAVASDPNIAIVAWGGFPLVPSAPGPITEYYEWIAQGFREGGKHGVLVFNVVDSIVEKQLVLLRDAGLESVLPGLEFGLRAVAHALDWSARIADAKPLAEAPGPAHPDIGPGLVRWSEAQALRLLESAGIPVVPWRLCDSPANAVAMAAELGLPVAVKVVSPDIVHKSDVGGVVLNCAEGPDVAAAFGEVTRNARIRSGARIDGAIVSAMRTGGIEMVLGAVRDPEWGIVLAVGLGGTEVEIIDDKSLRLLPISSADARSMLDELRSPSLSPRARTTGNADLDRLSEVIAAFAALALSLGPRLESIEINPLYVSGTTIEALDAVVTWTAEASDK